MTAAPAQAIEQGQSINNGTRRTDNWWVEPAFTIAALGFFAVYGIWAAAQNAHYEWGPYLSPFYSPNLKEMMPEAFEFLKFSPAFLVLWAPLGFRGTCYFYRRAYYRAFFSAPPACAVMTTKFQNPLSVLVGKGKNYKGETVFPWVLQNLHRYFFYVAVVLTILHWYHSAMAFVFDDGLGIGVGSIVLLMDAVLLTLYVLSCHCWRHMLGGRLNNFTNSVFSKFRHHSWLNQTKLNEHHMEFAWTSLFMVGFADFYVRMVSMGVIPDIMILQTGVKFW